MHHFQNLVRVLFSQEQPDHKLLEWHNVVARKGQSLPPRFQKTRKCCHCVLYTIPRGNAHHLQYLQVDAALRSRNVLDYSEGILRINGELASVFIIIRISFVLQSLSANRRM